MQNNIEIKNKGFSLIEMLVAMALLTIVMTISINVLVLVGKTARKVDYQVNVTQESTYAAERIRRLVRSADNFDTGVGGNSISVSVQAEEITFSLQEVESGSGEYILYETVGGDSQAVMASDIIVKKFSDAQFFEEIIDPTFGRVGIRMTFQVLNEGDDEETAGAIVSTQAINRSLVLN